MSHVITSTQKGAGSGGSAESRVEWAPAHTVPPAVQIHKIERAARALDRINDFLYGDGPDPTPSD